ncbi:helix-turn-helix domain-containing protein [Mesorhizobium sp. CO1-1-4]|nr:helix-turn-helix domain-containing protein [Mesorhizobium sp. CO1-1-4]MBZ9800139.1 helix-turn-helix domain-containing protein [Mesorhizobium sp. ES1-6]
MDERLRFVVECLSGEETMTQLCAGFEISRKTGYKRLARYREFGPEACKIGHVHRLSTAVRRQRRWLSGSCLRRKCIRCGVPRRSWPD